MSCSVSGKTVLITGAAKRIGRAIALLLADSGANIIAHFRSSQEEADDLVAAVKARGPEAWKVPGALDNPADCELLFAQAQQVAGSIDILINNASIFHKNTLADFTPEDLHTNIDINALSPLLLARQFAEQVKEGSVINILDTRIADYDREHVAYHLSKRLLFSLTRMMAVEFAPDIRVNGVAPGLILPPAGEDEEYLKKLAHTNPLRRYGHVDDVAGAVRFLLDTDFITGQIIYVDGGRHLKGKMYD